MSATLRKTFQHVHHGSLRLFFWSHSYQPPLYVPFVAPVNHPRGHALLPATRLLADTWPFSECSSFLPRFSDKFSFKHKLFSHISPPRCGGSHPNPCFDERLTHIFFLDDYILHARLPSSLCSSQAPFYFLIRESNCRKSSICPQNILHVCSWSPTSSCFLFILFSSIFTSRFVAILFLDALQRMFRVSAESELAKSSGHHTADIRADTNLAARKF